jgi:hypothetical protein
MVIINVVLRIERATRITCIVVVTAPPTSVITTYGECECLNL